jgi:hypothetical protein
MEFVDGEDDARVIAVFQLQRDGDYDEIVEQCERLAYELDRETEKEKFTYAEIEENETELARIHKWMERIVAGLVCGFWPCACTAGNRRC